MAEVQKASKEVTVKIGGAQFTVSPGAKVKDAAASAGIAIPSLMIDPKTCKGCQMCIKVCESGAISGNKKEPHSIDSNVCVRCGECLARCKTGSIIPV